MAEDIISWRESLSLLPDNHFFDIIRIYLGEIKTPYNKQKLIEDLSAFLRKDSNKQNIIRLITLSELEILAAVKFLPVATQEKLCLLFDGQYTFASFYEILMNLEERLVLYRHKDRISGKTVFSINPLLESQIEPMLKKDLLFPPLQNVQPADSNADNKVSLSPELLATVFSFVSENPDFLKADGTFKKRIEACIPEIFPHFAERSVLLNLIRSLINLNLFQKNGGDFVPHIYRWKQFARLPKAIQYAYISVAAAGHFPRDFLQKKAQLILDILCNIPESGISKPILMRMACFTQEKNDAYSVKSRHSERFAALLNQISAGTPDTENAAPAEVLASSETLINYALEFGLLIKTGTDELKHDVYKANRIFFETEDVSSTAEKLVSIDGGFAITVMPGLSLRNLLPIAMCSVPVRLDTILQAEITKKAFIRAFDSGTNPEEILSDIEKCLTHPLPQNLRFSCMDWYESYNSISIFKGYVLKIVPEKAVLIEKNPEFAPHIKMILAPGVYLLDFAGEEEASSVIESSGIDIIGSVKDLHPKAEPMSLAMLRIEPKSTGNTDSAGTEKSVINPFTKEETEDFQKEFFNIIDGKKLTVEQYEELSSRIKRRVVVNASQLREDSVRPEKNEATGMDYLGKIHVAEHAINCHNLLELTCDGKNYLVYPLKIEKHNSDSYLKALTQPDDTEAFFSLGRCQLVKRIRGPVFKEI